MPKLAFSDVLAVAEQIVGQTDSRHDVVEVGALGFRNRREGDETRAADVGLGIVAPRVLVTQRALHGEPVARPRILHEERIVPGPPLALELTRQLPELIGHAVVELVHETLRVGAVGILVVVVVEAVVAELDVVGAGDVREVRVPHVGRDPARRRREAGAAQGADGTIAEARDRAALFAHLDEVVGRVAWRDRTAPAAHVAAVAELEQRPAGQRVGVGALPDALGRRISIRAGLRRNRAGAAFDPARRACRGTPSRPSRATRPHCSPSGNPRTDSPFASGRSDT